MNGAQRASRSRSLRRLALPIVAAVIAFGGLAATPAPISAADVKVVIVVGPVESNTSRYISHGKRYAAQARAFGAKVVEIYSPNATWSRVKTAARGANIFIYLGHGNGHPSPYGAFYADRKNGVGLNKSAGHGHRNLKYYGESYVRTGLDLDKNAVVLLNHLCYASGNSEPGRGNPTTMTARKRVDGYGAGFLRAGARAVFANGHGSVSSILKALLVTDKTVGQIFQDDPDWSGSRDFKFASSRTKGYTAWMDPEKPGRYYHSVIGKMDLKASQVRAGG
jgi:hypothetical protein